MIGIYKITSPSGKIYIGQSIDISLRFSYYLNINKSKKQRKLHNSFKKYGPLNHIFEIVEECDSHLLNECERYWQEYYNVMGFNGLNCRLTGTNDKSGHLSKETRKKMSESALGKIITSETRKKISKALKGKTSPNKNKFGSLAPHFGKTHSELTKGTMREKRKGWVTNCKPLIDTKTNKLYNSIKEAAIEFNINPIYLRKQLRGESKPQTHLQYTNTQE